MHNETQNQDTQAAPQQQPVVEEAQAAPEQAMDDAQAATSEVVHDDSSGIPQQQEQEQQGIAVGEPDPSSPGVEPVSEEGLNPAETPDPAVTMNPEDLSGPETAGDTSDFLAGDVTNSYIELGEPDFTSEGGDAGFISDEEAHWYSEYGETDSVPDSGRSIWDFPIPDIPEDDDSTSGGLDIDGEVKDYAADDWSWDSEPSDVEEVVSEEPTPGGYDGSGIAGGLDLDQNGVFDQIENNPDILQPGYPGNDPAGQHEGNVFPDEAGTDPDASDGGDYTYDEGAYEDAEDAFEDLQDALQDGDEEDLAEALEELQGYLGGFNKVGAEDEDPDPTGADTEEVPNTVDKEAAVDAPDASGAAVSGPAVGAAGAAVDEAKGLDQDGTETQDNQILSGSDYYDGAFGTMGDTDGDGVLNWEDSDWDTFDRDGDGKEDYLVLDADDDGIVDVKEDADGDGIVDVQDVDADNDGTDDWLVSDFDGDGIEYGKEDDDSDGIENAKDDSDGDGMLDWKDSDSDGNGIDDWEEIFSDPYEFDCFPGEDSYDYSW